MNTRRFETALPLVALVISFFAVLALGRTFATDDRSSAPDQPTPSPIVVPSSPPASPTPTAPSTDPSSTPGQTATRIEITIRDLNQDQLAPGLLQRQPLVDGQPPRVCMVPGLMADWVPEDLDQWSADAGTLCREVKANQQTGEFVLTWVRR